MVVAHAFTGVADRAIWCVICALQGFQSRLKVPRETFRRHPQQGDAGEHSVHVSHAAGISWLCRQGDRNGARVETTMEHSR